MIFTFRCVENIIMKGDSSKEVEMKREQGNSKEFNFISQKIAEAIESVLNIDVTIMNHHMIRIAGTGKYKEECFKKIKPNTAFDVCLKTGKDCVVETSGQGEICEACDLLDTCSEKAEICVPIIYKSETIGVIGVIAFDDNQRDVLLNQRDTYMNFFRKMADLLVVKYMEGIMQKENEKLSIKLDQILKSMKQAVITFDVKGNLFHKNEPCDILLEKIAIENPTFFYKALWKELNEKNKRLISMENMEISVVEDKKVIRFLADVTRINMKETVGSANYDEILVVLRDYDELQLKMIRQTEQAHFNVDFDTILGISRSITAAKNMAKSVSETHSNIMIYGESGTGKELFARAIHHNSKRSNKPFVPINCGAIPDELLESELFGYEKGAFTGALNAKIGKFEVADGGTILLDEISELPLRLQVKLLRVLQEGEICRLGSNDIKKVDVRIISATNKNLKEQMEAGLFRTDLYYRLNIIPIELPPLREREDDIEYLSNYFINHFNQVFGKTIKGLTKESEKLFKNHLWPGNIRELQNVIEFAVCVSEQPFVEVALLEKRLESSIEKGILKQEGYGKEKVTNKTNVRNFERETLEKLLLKYKGLKHKSMVMSICEEMGISRATFYRKKKELDNRNDII